MSKRLLVFVLGIVMLSAFLLNPSSVKAADDVNLYFFYSDTCPHCATEHEFLSNIKDDYPGLNIYGFEVTKSRDNARALVEVAEYFDTKASSVPYTVIGEEVVIGYSNNETTGKQITNAIDNCLGAMNICADPLYGILGIAELVGDIGDTPSNTDDDPIGEANGQTSDDGNAVDNLPYIVSLPIFGEVDLKAYSLPVVTVMIGFIDGFNPCAMWVLLFLISLLLGMKNRFKMWALGSIFIVASAFMYFLFMAAWLNAFLFLSFVIWVRILVGLVAIVAGFYHLREYYNNRDGVCKVTNNEKRRRIFDSLKLFVQEKSFFLAVGGIIVIAFAVNLVELVCSAGFPAIYTQVLALSDLGGWSYYGYLLLYILFFMLDDLVVFIIAMSTLRAVGLSGKYSRYSSLIGGILILILGFLLILRPEWLVFG